MIGLPILLKIAPFAVAGVAAVAAYQFAPLVGVNAQRHRLQTQVQQWHVSSDAFQARANAWRASFEKSEKLRGEENQAAVAAVSATQDQCDARVAEARRSSQAIRKVLNAPVKLDANNCPVRAVLDTDSLRDALGAH